jgi:uncharacterized lipoprotein YajG
MVCKKMKKKTLLSILMLLTLAILISGCQKSELSPKGGDQMLTEKTRMGRDTLES